MKQLPHHFERLQMAMLEIPELSMVLLDQKQSQLKHLMSFPQ
jgi:hypothetical protein